MQLFDYKRASALMREAELDLVIAHSRSNVSYLLDYYAHGVYNESWLLDDGSMLYQSFVGLPADEALGPFYTPWVGEEGHLSDNDPWITNRYFFGAKMAIPGVSRSAETVAAHPVEAAVAAIEDRRLTSARIGVEMSLLPVEAFERLRARLPNAEIADGGPVLARLRSIKCADEVRRLKLSAAATERAIRTAYESTQVGTTELEFDHRLRVSLAKAEAEYEWAHVAFGPKGASDVKPRDVAAKPGEPLRVDLGGGHSGYVCDMSRVGVLGDPIPELMKAVDAAHETYKAVRGAMKAGVRGGDLHDLGSRTMSENGYRLFSFMVGHGVGRDAHEWPFVVKGSDVFLEAGMTITVEIPLRIQGLGSINLEDVVLVTDDGCESINTLDPDLFRI